MSGGGLASSKLEIVNSPFGTEGLDDRHVKGGEGRPGVAGVPERNARPALRGDGALGRHLDPISRLSDRNGGESESQRHEDAQQTSSHGVAFLTTSNAGIDITREPRPGQEVRPSPVWAGR